MKNILALCLVCSLLLSSCTTTYQVSLEDDYTKRFVGMAYKDIVSQLGAPNRCESDGAGGTILVYENFQQQSIAIANPYTFLPTAVSRSYTNTQYIQLYTNSENVCYKIKTNHTRIEKKPAPGRTAALIAGCVAYVAILATVWGIALSL